MGETESPYVSNVANLIKFYMKISVQMSRQTKSFESSTNLYATTITVKYSESLVHLVQDMIVQIASVTICLTERLIKLLTVD